MAKTWYERFAEKQRKLGKNRLILDRDGQDVYLERFYLIPRWATLGLVKVFIHRFWKSDDDINENGVRSFHSHPWIFWGTFILKNGYIEHTPKGDLQMTPGSIAIKSGWASHWVELHKNKKGKEKECWTIFFVGPKIKSWGFKDSSTRKEIPWNIYLAKKLKIKKNADNSKN